MNVTKHPDGIELKPSELIIAIADCIRANRVPITLSHPGAGKSDMYKHVIEEVLRMRMVDERSSTMNETDWRGVPDTDRKRQRTVWYAPNFLPGPEDPDTVVFIDEITQTPPQCQAPLLNLFLDRKIGTVYTAPPNTRFCAAGNLMDDGTFSNKLGAALRLRVTFLYLKPDLDDWCKWAYAHNVAPSVIAYNRFKGGGALAAFDKNEWSSPTPRGWEMVSDIIQRGQSTGRIREALIEGTIGHAHCVEFVAFERIFNELPSIDAIILNPDTAMVPDRPELRYAITNALSLKSTVANFARVLTYISRLPEEFGVFCVKMAARRDAQLSKTPAFTRWMVDHAASMG